MQNGMWSTSEGLYWRENAGFEETTSRISCKHSFWNLVFYCCRIPKEKHMLLCGMEQWLVDHETDAFWIMNSLDAWQVQLDRKWKGNWGPEKDPSMYATITAECRKIIKLCETSRDVESWSVLRVPSIVRVPSFSEKTKHVSSLFPEYM